MGTGGYVRTNRHNDRAGHHAPQSGVVAPKVSKVEAMRFFNIMAPGERITFQTFTDAGPGKVKPRPDPLACILHGYPEERFDALCRLNARGAGVFWMVNRGDGKGRSTKNVVEVRYPFADLDGAPLSPVIESPYPPHVVVESSPAKYHAYWQNVDCLLDCFTPMQIALARHFDADESVSDLPRVLRVPGFLHQKGKPFMTRIVSVHK